MSVLSLMNIFKNLINNGGPCMRQICVATLTAIMAASGYMVDKNNSVRIM